MEPLKLFLVTMLQKKSPVFLFFYLYFFCSFLSFLILIFLYIGGQRYDFTSIFSNHALSVYIVLLAFMSIFSQYFQGLAFSYGKPDTLASFLYLSVVFAGIWGWLIFGNIPGWLAILGSILVIFGGSLKALVILLHFKQTHSHKQ